MHGYQMEITLAFALATLGSRKFLKLVRLGALRFITDDDSNDILPFCDLEDA